MSNANEHDRTADHVFISYAWEDIALAQWIEAKLVSQGYKVWRDQEQLLGGESMTTDIDEAIKHHTHRMIGILSTDSLSKPNPTKERTLALHLGRERNVPFLILVNAGVEPTDLHWNLSDVVFVDFRWNWADGLHQLLKALKKADTPVDPVSDPDLVANSVIPDDLVLDRDDHLTTNLFPILKLPGAIQEISTRFQTRGVDWDTARKRWPAYSIGNKRCLALSVPHEEKWRSQCQVVNAHRIADRDHIDHIPLVNILKNLLVQALRARGMELGMATKPDGSWLHFPRSIIDTGPQSIIGLDGKKTTVSLGGTRSYFVAGKGTAPYHYYLAPRFNIRADIGDELVVQIGGGVHVTDTRGQPLESRTALSRRKHATSNWWNWEWGHRHIAIATFLAQGQDAIEYGGTEDMMFRVSAEPYTCRVRPAINDALIEKRRHDRLQLRRSEKNA